MVPDAKAAREGHCVHCRSPLTRLQRLRGRICEASACRWRQAQSDARARRDAHTGLLRAQAVARHGAAVQQAPVVWLRSFRPTIGVLAPELRVRHAEHLAAIVAEPEAHRRDPLIDFADETGPPPPIDRTLCSHCQGRCCRAGVGRHGFVDLELLQRQAQRHGGTLADGAAHYMARLPAVHVLGSCVYQGSAGCVLPRDERAPVCNGFACDSLRDARRFAQEAGAADAAGMLVVEVDEFDVRGGAWFAGAEGPVHALTAPVRADASPPSEGGGAVTAPGKAAPASG